MTPEFRKKSNSYLWPLNACAFRFSPHSLPSPSHSSPHLDRVHRRLKKGLAQISALAQQLQLLSAERWRHVERTFFMCQSWRSCCCPVCPWTPSSRTPVPPLQLGLQTRTTAFRFSLERVLVPSRDTGMQEDGHTSGVYGLCSGEAKFGSSGIYFLVSYYLLTL